MERSKSSSRRKVLLGCFLCMFFVQGGIQTFAIFMPQIAADTGWEFKRVALISTVSTVSAFAANISLPVLVRKLGAKRLMLFGALLLGVHFTLFSLIKSVLLFNIEGLVGGVVVACGTIAPCSIVINNWFVKNRSQYIAIVVAAAMFGSVLLNPLAAALIDLLGWRGAYRALALLISVCAGLSVLLLVTESPAQKGELAYGLEEKGSSTSACIEASGLETRDVQRSLSFPLLLLGVFLLGLSTNIENYMPSFFQSEGMSSVSSSAVMSAYALIAAVCSLVMSKLNDRLGGRSFVLISSLCFVAAVLVMSRTVVVSSMPLLILCCVPLAVGGKKASGMTPPLVIAEVFGRRSYAAIIGSFTAMLQLGIAASNIVIGWLLPRGYSCIFAVMAVINLSGMLCMFTAILKKPWRQDVFALKDKDY